MCIKLCNSLYSISITLILMCIKLEFTRKKKKKTAVVNKFIEAFGEVIPFFICWKYDTK